MSLFDELKRRKVLRVALGYIVAAWVFAQVADLVADNFLAPPWVMQMIIAVLIIGFPVTLILSWIFDIGPEGIERESVCRAAAHDEQLLRGAQLRGLAHDVASVSIANAVGLAANVECFASSCSRQQ